MSNLTTESMPGLNIEPLLKTLLLEKLDDDNMVNFLRSNLIDSISPNPSVETLLHAYFPHKYVDHTHSNAFFVQSLLKKTTGNIITVDGGYIEASLR